MIFEGLMIGTMLVNNVVGAYRHLFPANTQQSSTTSPAAPAGHNTQLSHAMRVEGQNITQHFNAPSSVLHNTNHGVPMYNSAQEYLKKSKVYLSDVASTMCQYCKDNKYYLAAFTIASSYGYLYYKVHTIKNYISNPNTWSAWMQDVPFEQLLGISHDKLTHDLIATIQSRYTTPQNPTDFLTPLIEFSKDIEKEKQLLTNYHSYISWGAQFSLQKIIPFSNQLLSQLTERKQRIVYLNTLFQTWLTNYKLEQITR